jgi:predicted ribosomally synthesized peptide with nif11-like leader
MSKENVKSFFKVVGEDASLKDQVEGAMKGLEGADGKAIGNKLIELGAGAGFSFSLDDLMAAREELMDLANAENSDLSDEDLDAVAGGGKVGAIVASVISAGVICAAASIITIKNDDPRNCRELVEDVTY